MWLRFLIYLESRPRRFRLRIVVAVTMKKTIRFGKIQDKKTAKQSLADEQEDEDRGGNRRMQWRKEKGKNNSFLEEHNITHIHSTAKITQKETQTRTNLESFSTQHFISSPSVRFHFFPTTLWLTVNSFYAVYAKIKKL